MQPRCTLRRSSAALEHAESEVVLLRLGGPRHVDVVDDALDRLTERHLADVAREVHEAAEAERTAGPQRGLPSVVMMSRSPRSIRVARAPTSSCDTLPSGVWLAPITE